MKIFLIINRRREGLWNFLLLKGKYNYFLVWNLSQLQMFFLYDFLICHFLTLFWLKCKGFLVEGLSSEFLKYCILFSLLSFFWALLWIWLYTCRCFWWKSFLIIWLSDTLARLIIYWGKRFLALLLFIFFIFIYLSRE